MAPGRWSSGAVGVLPRSDGVGKEAGVAEDGFAVTVYRDGGRWDCALLPPAVLDDLDSCVAALRQQPAEGGPVALVDVADEFFVALRLTASGDLRVLLSDVTAAEEWDLAQQALDLAAEGQQLGPVDPEEVWPVGDLGIFRDLGLDEWELGTILGDVDLWADEMLTAVAGRIGVGEPFARVLASLQESAVD
jgi:putative tRNA adenosine deaminase-associated protein